MNKLIFIYDKLMTKDEQVSANLELELISFAQFNSKLYWISDGKRKRYFAMPPKGITTNLIYGGLFLLKDYQHNKHKLHSYYNNSIPYTNTTLIEDIYDFKSGNITPIKFNSLKCIERNDYTKGEPIECCFFVGNSKNKRILYNSSRNYYKVKGVDTINFIKMIKENCV